MTAMYKSSSCMVTMQEDYLGLYHEVKLKGVKVDSLKTFFLKMEEELKVQKLLDLMVAIATKEADFNASLKFNQVRNNLVELRRYILNLNEVKEDKLLANLFKRAFKEDLTSSCKAYYKLCKKAHQEYVNELLNELFVFSVKENKNISIFFGCLRTSLINCRNCRIRHIGFLGGINHESYSCY